MKLWDKIRGYLQLRSNRRKVLIGGVAVLAVIGLIIFGANLDALFTRTPSRAGINDDLTKTWKNLNTGSTNRAHAKSIVVQQGGKSWLYVLGGLEIYTDVNSGETRNRLLKTVERIEINPNDGSPVIDAQWQTMRTMNTGHAEFGILQTTVGSKPYIYVVAGDIHIPTIDAGKELIDVPLLYSTIERLDLSVTNANWEIVTKLTGINFYPEVAMFNNRLQVVGGVFGNPFGGAALANCNTTGGNGYGTGTSSGPNGGIVTDPINPTADANLWNQTKNLPNVGPSQPILPVASTNGGHQPVTQNYLVTSPATGAESGVGAGANDGLNRPLTQTTQRWLAKVPSANAQSTEPVITHPVAGEVIKSGITYTIQVENLTPNYYNGQYYNEIKLEYNVNHSDSWTYITGSHYNIPDTWGPNGITRFYHDWVVPTVTSNDVRVRAVLINHQGDNESTIANITSGRFSINTSLAHELSLQILAGKFVTTVSEYYSINLANPGLNPVISELGNDFSGTFLTPWGYGSDLSNGGIMRLGHLRFTTVARNNYRHLFGNPSFGPLQQEIVPVPQGRYGHKLFQNDVGQLVVVGGASWMPRIMLTYTLYPLNTEITQDTKYFWVIENSPFPTYQPIDNYDTRFIPTNGGGYIGHIAYTLNSGTNAWNPSTQFSFNTDSGTGTKGRAFFGLARSGDEWTVVGGLENANNQYQIQDITLYTYGGGFGGGSTPPANTYIYAGGVKTQATNRTLGFQTTGWQEREDYVNGEAVYNLSAFGLNDRMIAYGGQQSFCPSSYRILNPSLINNFPGDPHVPDPTQPASNTTALYQRATDPALHSWHQMAPLGLDPVSGEQNGTANVIFSADTLAVATLSGGTTSAINNFYIYRYGGFKQSDTSSSSVSLINQLQGLGVFTDAQSGVPYIPNSSFVITPSTVATDGYTSAVATVTLKDYFNQPVVGKHTLVYGPSPNHYPPQDIDDIKITPTGNERDPEFDVHYLKTDVTGVASFNLTSLKLGTYAMNASWTDVPNATQGIIGPQAVTFTDINVPDQNLSNIETDQHQVAADGLDIATITVTLRGKNSAGVPNSPLPNFYVKIISNRNVGDNAIDTITIKNSKTDSNGQAKFELKSNTKGLATISAFYADTADKLANDQSVKLNQTVSVRFVGKIMSLTPDYGVQGTTIDSLVALGEQTSWQDADPRTVVSFARPSHIDIESTDGLVLSADQTRTSMAIVVNNKPVGTAVKLEILPKNETGWGSFYPHNYGQEIKQLNLVTDADGKARFIYEHGIKTGVVELKATVGTEIRTFKLILANLTAPYEVQLFANPTLLDSTHDSSSVRAMLYQYDGSNAGKTRIHDPNITVKFYTDDNGTLTPPESDIDVTTEWAASTYHRGSQTGSRRVFATIAYAGYLLSGVPVEIGDFAAGGINFADPDGVSISPTEEKITISNIAIASDAELGYWNFVTTTNISGPVSPEEFETLSYPFLVVATGTSTRPSIVSITPQFINAPTTGYQVTIVGQYTNFLQGASAVSFTHTTDANGSGLTIPTGGVTVINNHTIEVNLNAADNATIGYWDVKVDTTLGSNHEIAEKAGNTDFLVTTTNGYQFVITASPNALYRDGTSIAQLTTKVGKIDNATGQITPIDGVKLTYGLEGGTGGILQKNGIDSDTTHDGGFSYNSYTTDKGSESAEIYVRVSGTVDNIPLTTRVMILRKVADGDFITLVANPIALPLAGTPDSSQLTATAVGADGQPVPTVLMSFLIVEGPGTIVPANTNTAGGVATATYYRSNNLQLPTTVKVVAKATIPNVGTVFSNEAVINIGATNSDYNITLTSDKSSVSVGGSEKATLTATLTYKGTAMNRYPINFSILEGRNGDYLTTLSGRTNAQGKLTTEFVAGIYAGNIMVVATPIGLQSAFAPITKTADQAVNPRLSTISIVPALMPADNTSVALITVTLRNAQFSPLGGKSVTVTTSRTANDTLSPIGSQLTDGNGQVFFTIRSGQIGISNVTAHVGALSIGPAKVQFEDPANLVSIRISAKVPLEAKAYNREVKTYVREKAASADVLPVINEVYLTDPASEKLTGIPTTIYLHRDKTYSFWVKGRYHLARAKTFDSPATNGTIIELDFTDSGKGLYIADLSSGGASEIFPGFNDNKINTIDIAVISASWFKNSYLADFNGDSIVNTIDIAYWAANWFHNPGAPLP